MELDGRDRILAIKRIMDVEGLSLKEAKAEIDRQYPRPVAPPEQEQTQPLPPLTLEEAVEVLHNAAVAVSRGDLSEASTKYVIAMAGAFRDLVG